MPASSRVSSGWSTLSLLEVDHRDNKAALNRGTKTKPGRYPEALGKSAHGEGETGRQLEDAKTPSTSADAHAAQGLPRAPGGSWGQGFQRCDTNSVPS